MVSNFSLAAFKTLSLCLTFIFIIIWFRVIFFGGWSRVLWVSYTWIFLYQDLVSFQLLYLSIIFLFLSLSLFSFWYLIMGKCIHLITHNSHKLSSLFFHSLFFLFPNWKISNVVFESTDSFSSGSSLLLKLYWIFQFYHCIYQP